MNMNTTTGRPLLVVAALATLALGAGCFSPNSTTCDNGSVCPPGYSCEDGGKRCVSAAKKLPCLQHAEGDGCTFENGPGACRSGVCELFFCGDGYITNGEVCDGAPPPGKSCLDYGFDRGLLGCTDHCQPALEGCGSFSAWTTWSIPAPATGILNGVWASSSDDVYIVAKGILHWDGTRWSTAIPDVTFNEVWGSGPNDVYAVGPGVAHWDGSRWSAIADPGLPAASFDAVWGSGPRDVFVVGSVPGTAGVGSASETAGVMAHWNGASWDRVVDPTFAAMSRLSTVWGTGAKDVFVAGLTFYIDDYGYRHDTTHIFHWDGSTWSDVFGVSGAIYGFGGSGPGDVYGVGSNTPVHWDGTSWSLLPPADQPLAAVWVGGPDEVFAVGPGGNVFNWDGASWAVSGSGSLSAGPAGPDSHPGGIFGTAGTVFAVGAPYAFRRERSHWSTVASLTSVSAVWASGPSNAYAVGYDGLSHWDGTRWTATGPAAIQGLTSVWGSGPDDVYAVGNQGTVVHWDGSAWSTSTSAAGPADLESVSGSGRGDVFAVGHASIMAGGKAGSGGGPMGAGGSTGSMGAGAAGSGATTGSSGGGTAGTGGTWALVHGTGTSWSTVWSSDPFFPMGVWASSSDNVFVVGNGGINSASIYRWNGAALSPMSVLNPAYSYNFDAVWGSGPDDVYAVGDPILHWDGAQWSDASAGTPPLYLVRTVGGSGAGDVFIGGDDPAGGLAHRRAGIWEPVRIPNQLTASGLSVTPRRVFVVGGDAEIHLDRPSVTCVGPERDCNDGWDNDCDGLADGDDPDCKGKVVEQCANLADDDGDGNVDCADQDCAEFPSCKRAPLEGGPSGTTDPGGGGGSSGGTRGPTKGGVGGAAPLPPGGPGTGGANGSASGGAPSVTPENLISDFEDETAASVVVAGNPARHGYWYTYNDDAPAGTDPLCLQIPKTAQQSPTGGWVPYPGEAPPGGVRNGSTGRLALHGSWHGCSVWGAGVGASLNAPVDPAGGTYSGPAIPYDVTPFSGVTFWAMAAAGTDANLRIKFPMTDDVGADNGGLCVETAATGKCYDDYGEPFSFPADGTWHQITVRWSDPSFRQEGWGIRFPWTPAHVVSIQIQSSDKGANYDFWIDDLYFFN